VNVEKVTQKTGFGYYEKITQIKADYPGLIVPGGQYGVIHEREKSGNEGNRKGVPKRGQERKRLDPGPSRPAYRI
jgi:hypothetical protein